MPKRFRDFAFTPIPTPSTSTPTPSATSSCFDAPRFLTRIDSMRGCPEYEFADTTLTGIYDTVSRTKRVTDGQLTAVRRIYESPRGRDRDWEDFQLDDD